MDPMTWLLLAGAAAGAAGLYYSWRRRSGTKPTDKPKK
jgi:LPXTG-motif cell wall-anchored protein